MNDQDKATLENAADLLEEMHHAGAQVLRELIRNESRNIPPQGSDFVVLVGGPCGGEAYLARHEQQYIEIPVPVQGPPQGDVAFPRLQQNYRIVRYWRRSMRTQPGHTFDVFVIDPDFRY